MTYRIYGNEPMLVRKFEATRVLWGDETSGQVSDLVYGRGARISGLSIAYSIASHGGQA